MNRAEAVDQRFRFWARVKDRGFSGLFLGTYSPFAYLPYAGGRSACGSWAAASRSSRQPAWQLHRAAQGMPYAVALLKLSPIFSRDAP